MDIIHNFAVLEGGDGAGTSTQMELLAGRFLPPRGDGTTGFPTVYYTFEPTGGPIGSLIRVILKGGGPETPPMRPETIARLFAADRNEHLYGSGGIRERCNRGELVISDRYVLSSLVYQGIDCGTELPETLNAPFPGPEMLFFFDIDPEVSLKRIESRKDRDVYEYLDFQIKVRERYRELLPRYEEAGVRVFRIDASQKPEEVAEELWRGLQNMPILRRGRERN
jgi:dTMP kinase